jgi:DNA-directed RNA polymerase specialized sigma24 family protein
MGQDLDTHAMAQVDSYPSDLDDLRRLSPADRSVLYLSVVERRSHQEIAAPT